MSQGVECGACGGRYDSREMVEGGRVCEDCRKILEALRQLEEILANPLSESQLIKDRDELLRALQQVAEITRRYRA